MRFMAVVVNRKDLPPIVTVCAEYQAENVRAARAQGKKNGDIVWVVPVAEHWSARIAHPTGEADKDMRCGE